MDYDDSNHEHHAVTGRFFQRHQKGFTIVELLIVVVVIAILAAIAIVAYNGVSKRATESSMKSDLRSAVGRLEVDKNLTGSALYPTSLGAANEGKGLSSSNNTTLRYGLSGTGYCISITSARYSDLQFKATGPGGQITPGQCPPVVGPVAGSLVDLGTTDGPGATALFNEPRGIVSDSNGNLYVADYWNHRIRKIAPNHVVSTVAGSTQGFNDGTGAAAQFNYPQAIAIDSSGVLYVSDTDNNRIRKVTPAGVVTTFAGSGAAGWLDGTGTAAQFNSPRGIAVDSTGTVYVSDRSNHRIRKITPAGVVTTLVGTGTAGYLDNTGTAAQVRNPDGIAVDAAGNIYLADYWNRCIRKITPAGVVTTLAGTTAAGYMDGTGSAARFNSPWGIAVSPAGDIYVSDYVNNRIRKVTQAGVVTTVAGTGVAGAADGDAMSATFQDIQGMTFTPSGSLYITDRWNGVIRKLEFL